MMNEIRDKDLFSKIVALLDDARKKVAYSINTTMAHTYFLIGKFIVEDEQKGKARAEYGKEVLKTLSLKLTAKYGRGYSITNLKQMRDFYLKYSIGQTVSDQLTISKNTQTVSTEFEICSFLVFFYKIGEKCQVFG